MRFPHLAAMRRQATQRHRAIVEPYENSERAWMRHTADVENKLARINRILTADVAKHFFESLGREIARAAHNTILKAVWAAEHDGEGMVHISISREAIYTADTQSAFRMIIERARHLMADNLRVNVYDEPDGLVSAEVSVRQLNIPDIRMRKVLTR